MIENNCKNCNKVFIKERNNNKVHCSNRCARIFANKSQTIRNIGLPKTISSFSGEVWVSVLDFEGLYEVSNYSRVKSCIKKGSRNELIILFTTNKNGYNTISLLNGKKRKNTSVHRLVAQAFIPNPENKPQINHKNGIKTDNRIENLEWATASENTQHAYDTGLEKKKIGELNGRCILKELDVLKIKEFIKQPHSLVELGNRYGVSSSTISNIKRGKTWAHLKYFCGEIG